MLRFPSIWRFQSILILNILFDPYDLRQVGQPDSGKCGHVTQLAPSSSAPYSDSSGPERCSPLSHRISYHHHCGS